MIKSLLLLSFFGVSFMVLVEVLSAAESVDMEKIYIIESSGNPLAYNKVSQARGLGQITPIALADYNQYHKITFSLDDLFDEKINRIVSNWYMNVRIPQLLKHFRYSDTVENRLIAYNAGIKWVGQDSIPKETQRYIEKYEGVN